MKMALNIFFLLFCNLSFSQISIEKIIKPTSDNCDGKIVLKFVESELPGILTVDTPNNAGTITIEDKYYTMEDLCPGFYAFSLKDNHGCISAEVIDLGECDLAAIIAYERVGCENPPKFDVTLGNLPDGNLDFDWSNGSTESNLSEVAEGEYSVTIYDEYGCSQSLEVEVKALNFGIVNIINPTEGLCDGSFSVSNNYTEESIEAEIVILNDVGVLVNTIEFNTNEGILDVNGNLCLNEYYTIKIESDGYCLFSETLFFESEECVSNGVKIKLVEIVNPNISIHEECYYPGEYIAGSIEVALAGGNLDENNYELKLYKPISGEGNVLIESGIGKFKFENLDEGTYLLVVQNITTGCLSQFRYILRACKVYKPSFATLPVVCVEGSNSLGEVVEIHEIGNTTNGTNGKIVMRIARDGAIFGSAPAVFFKCYLITPSGIILDNPNIYTSLFDNNPNDGFNEVNATEYFVHFLGLSEIGEYQIIYDNFCDTEEFYATLTNCQSLLHFGNWLNTWDVWPKDREDKWELGPGYEEVEFAYKSISPCASLAICESENVPTHLESLDACNSGKYFYYEPFDPDLPCEGGVVKTYKYEMINGLQEVVYDESFEFSATGTRLDFTNKINQSTILAKFERYQVFHEDFGSEFDVCKTGNYCLFESPDIFEGIYTNEPIILTTCKEWAHVCDLYPNSQECNPATGDGGGGDDEEEVDCDIEPNSQGQCIPGYYPNEHGCCIQSQGPCDIDGECADGETCIGGNCFLIEDVDEGSDEDPNGEGEEEDPEANICDDSFTIDLTVDANGPPIEDYSVILDHNLGNGETFYFYIEESNTHGIQAVISNGVLLGTVGCNDLDNSDAYEFQIQQPDEFILIEVSKDDQNGNPCCDAQSPPPHGTETYRHSDKFKFTVSCEDPGRPELIDSSDVKDLILSNNSYLNETNFRFTPNPFAENIMIENMSNDNIEQIYIYSSVGKIVKSFSDINQGSISLDLTELLQGMYYIKVMSNKGSVTTLEKIVKGI